MTRRARSHYLKIPFGIRQYYPGVAPADWRQSIMADVVGANGTVVEFIPPNPTGPRLALHGDRFYVEVARDPVRGDLLYAIRIEPAKDPRSVPATVGRKFLLWPGGQPTLLDDAVDLFPKAPPAGSHDASSDTVEHVEETGSEPDELSLEFLPSPLLLRLLSSVPESVRSRFRPGNMTAEAVGAAEFLSSFAAVWRRHRLDRHTSLTGRQSLQLKGISRPPALSRGEREAFLASFGFDLLNRLALEYQDNPQRLYPILEDLGAVYQLQRVRLLVWSATLAGLSPAAMREELHISAEAMSLLRESDEGGDTLWKDELLRSLRTVATRSADSVLGQLVDDAETNDEPVDYVATWAARLEFKTEVAPTAPDPGVLFAVHAPVEVPEVVQGALLLDRWLIRSCLPDVTAVHNLRDEIAAVAGTLATLPPELASIAQTLELLKAASRLSRAVEQATGRIPDIATLEGEAAAAERAYQAASVLLGERAVSFLLEHDLEPDEVENICDLLDRQHALAAVPEWLWNSAGLEYAAMPPSDTRTYAEVLVSPVARRHIRTFVEAFEQLDDKAAAKWLSPPTQGEDIASHIGRWLDRSQEFLSSVPAELRPTVVSELSSFEDIESLSLVSSELENVCGRLGGGASAFLEAEIAGTPFLERRALLWAFRAAITAYEEEYGDVGDASFQALRTSARRRLGQGPFSGADGAAPIEVDHNWTEQSGSRATVVLRRPDDASEYGYIEAPLVLETDVPRTVRLGVDVEVKGDLRSAWPREWPNPEPGELAVPAAGWRVQSPDRKYHHSFRLRLPIRVRRGERPRVDIVLSLRDLASGSKVGESRSLRWDTVEPGPVVVTLRWSGATNPDYVRDHPIGPQAKAATLLDRLCAGSSVAVIAPRRFGKSTLVEYLLTAAEENRLLMPPAIVCTMYSGGAAFDYDELWGRVHDDLQKAIGTGLPRSTGGALPDVNAFDHVRRSARKRGYRGVVLLLDEAQLFFSRHGGTGLGTRLKNALERHWSRAEEPDKVPLLFGLIGLPSLRDRAGADLMGLLSPIESNVMNEGELRRLLVGMTSGLQTTREARLRLAESAGNLFILRALLEKLVAAANREGRVWINYDDVVAIEDELRRELQLGREETVASYIRDAFNGAERVVDWEPIPSFPVAVALAHVRQHRRAFVDYVDRAVQQLNRWCEAAGPTGTSIARYRREIVLQHLQQLHERRIVSDADFSSSLLEAWLGGVARNGIYDDAFRGALAKGAIRHVPLPGGAEPIAEGAQAKIFRVSDERGQLAYRVRPLGGKAEQDHFHQTLEIFDSLRSSSLRTEPGGDHLFELIDVGLSAENSDDAVQVYRWVDGQDLSARKGIVAIDMVVHLGVKLARALTLLHRHNILHRDIRPANIVLEERLMRPVLIDFGFARRVQDEMHTAIGGDYSAPEVAAEPPSWSRSADVFALGATLRSLVNPVDKLPPALKALFEKATALVPAERPSAADLLRELELLEDQRGLEAKRDDVWRQVKLTIEPDRHKAWFTEVLHKKRPHFEAMALGFYPGRLDRFREIADFLNQVAESFHPPGYLSLRRLSLQEPQNQSVALLVALRSFDAHAGQARSREAKEAIDAFAREPLDHQLSTFLSGVESVSMAVKLKSLKEMISQFLPRA